MSQTQLSQHTPPCASGPWPAGAARDADLPLTALVYRSRARRALSDTELHRLTLDAQERNDRAGITGLLVYDDGRFFQWIEGPDENVARVMDSIRNDPRHDGIEILHRKTSWERVFENWSMKLAVRTAPTDRRFADALFPPAELVGQLHRQPATAADLMSRLAVLSDVDGADPSFLPDQINRAHLNGQVAAIVKRVLLSAVVPDLARSHGANDSGPGRYPANPRVAELVELLLATDQEAARELIRELQFDEGWMLPLASTLFEPAARRLGDLWSEDQCSEFDVTLGLCRIQAAARLLAQGVPRSTTRATRRTVPRGRLLARPASILIAPEPGELHGLGAALESEALWNAGWSPRCERPADDRSLEELVSGSWFDVLDVSFSAAFQREHWLSRLTTTIARARRASMNPALLVVVGGRIFAERRKTSIQVGADLTSMTASTVDELIRLAMARRSAGSNLSPDVDV